MEVHSLAREITRFSFQALLELQEGYLAETVFNSAYESLCKQRRILSFS